MMLKLINKTGLSTLKFLYSLGHFCIFIFKTFTAIFSFPIYWHELGKQLFNVGYNSLPVIGLTAVFTGMVLALQSYTGFSRFAAENALAIVIVLSITRELAPVLAGLMVAGRVGASIAAEIGTMRITEQIDALIILSANPFRYLVAPRVLAGCLMLPCLVFVSDIIGIMGGYIVAVHKLNFNYSNYMQQTINYLEMQDVIFGLIKASVFGGIITIMGCYCGYNSKGGAQGVGESTTNAVVYASIFILISNYLLTILFFDK